MTLVERLRTQLAVNPQEDWTQFAKDIAAACDELERLTWVEKNHLQGIAMLERRVSELEAALDRALEEWKAWMDLSDGGDFQASNDDDREIFAHCSLALKPDWQEPQPFEVEKSTKLKMWEEMDDNGLDEF